MNHKSEYTDGCSTYGPLAKQAGFTLIELMGATVVLAIGILSLAHLQLVTLRGSTYARQRTEAQQIAAGVAEEMRARGIGFVDIRTAPNPTFDQVFKVAGEINLTLPAAVPGLGTTLATVDGGVAGLRAVMYYMGVQISTDENAESAGLINVHGQLQSATLQGARAAYRVHYVAHQVPIRPEDIANGLVDAVNPDLVRVTVIVSWDNNDHGDQSYGYDTWWDAGQNFWKRHMVTVTFYLARTRTY